MSEYGTLIGATTLHKVATYNYFVYYFDNPQMKKIKTTNGKIMYGCKVRSHLSRTTKYVLAITNEYNAPRGESVTLDQLQWDSLQTRLLDEQYNVPTHTYIEKNDTISTCQITVKEKTQSAYTYVCEKLPGMKIMLLFGPSQTRIFSDTGTVKVAVEMYTTMVIV